MRDEQISEIALALQLAQEIHHLRLEQHVERTGRLVQHDEARLQHGCARDADALALAAGELMRIAEPRLGIEPDILQRLDNTRLTILRREKADAR
jgi:hypothetical protein